MMPKPVRRDPGSRPRIRTLTAGPTRVTAAGSNARQDVVRYLDIRIHVPDVVQLLDRSVGVGHDVLGARLERHLDEALFVGARWICHETDRIEEIADRAVG